MWPQSARNQARTDRLDRPQAPSFGAGSGWSLLLLARRIEQKATASAVTAVFANPRFTSQQCRRCDHTEAGNRDNQAFRCLACGHQDHADVNAAKNVLARGLLLIATGEIVPAHAPGHGAYACHAREPALAAAGTIRDAA